MLTGYTAFIENENITTGKEFLKLCTRAFGIAVSLRDEPLTVATPSVFETNPYFHERYERALEELEEAKNITFEEAKFQMRKSYEERISSCKHYAQNAMVLNEKYEKVRKEVEEWMPPTEDHKELKKFALNQIDISITKQESIDRHLELAEEEYDDSDEAVQNYIDENIEFCQNNVERYYNALQEDLENVRKKNEWMQKFLESLEE